MEKFTIHSIPDSPFGRAVVAAFEEKGASFRFATVAPGTLRRPEHLARHPFGRVPATPRAAARNGLLTLCPRQIPKVANPGLS